MILTYNEFIQNILDTRGRFGVPEGEYKERHHVIPKCLGGTNDKNNLIDLYAKEHYIAHKLLALENPSNNGLQFAWWNMCQIHGNSEQSRYEPSPEEFEEARKRCALLSSENNTGENHPMFGKHLSDEQKEFLREKFTGSKNPKAKKVVCEELIYDTLFDFCKKNELKSSTVSQWLNGKVKMPSVWVNKGLKYYIEEGD